ncbi:MAG: cytochrome c-type biogenesis CcmF C-terminal domain-containing protein [Collinsella intestinalis]
MPHAGLAQDRPRQVRPPHAHPRHRRRGGVRRAHGVLRTGAGPRVSRDHCGRRRGGRGSCRAGPRGVLLRLDGARLRVCRPAVHELAVSVVAVCAAVCAKGEGTARAGQPVPPFARAGAGGYLCHLGVAIVVVGLVGSMMYVREATVNLAGEAGESVRVGAYELTFTDSERYSDDQNNEIMRVELDVRTPRPGGRSDTWRPLWVAAATSQTTLDAAVITFPLEDLFVAFQGLNPDGSLSLNVKVNPLILFTWRWRDLHAGHRARVRAPSRHAALAADERSVRPHLVPRGELHESPVPESAAPLRH